MKALNVLFLIFCAGIMVCCGPAEENDSPDPGYFNSIQGKWYPVETISRGVSHLYTGHELCGKDYLAFNRDSSVEFVNIQNCRQYAVNNGTFSISGYRLTLQYNQNEKILLEIVHLDAASMDLIFIDDLDGDGVEEEIRRYSRE